MWSQPRLLSAARSMIAHLARRLGFDEITAGQVSLAIDEALCNVINHGYERRADGRIWLSVWAIETDPAEIAVVIEDRAKTVDPTAIQGRDLDDVRPGGLGVYIMREVMDLVQYDRRPGGGMKLTMRKRNVPGEPPAGHPGADAGADIGTPSESDPHASGPTPTGRTDGQPPHQPPQTETGSDA
jgi:anti-sigma regulatory factor (Ser/Thr protein kinase)